MHFSAIKHNINNKVCKSLFEATEFSNYDSKHIKSSLLLNNLQTFCIIFMTIETSLKQYEEVQCCLNKA